METTKTSTTKAKGKAKTAKESSSSSSSKSVKTKSSSSSLVSRRRHVVSLDQLESFGAVPYYHHDSNNGTNNNDKKEEEEPTMIGMTLGNCRIVTTQGPMANEAWLDEVTKACEDLSQPIPDETTAPPSEAVTTEEELEQGNNHHHYYSSRRRRRLTLPEIVFGQARVEIEWPERNLMLSWNATDVLYEWAAAHQHIAMGHNQSHRGVSVLKSIDAALWSSHDTNYTKTDFHYDWTYSTPFCTNNNNKGEWSVLKESGMNQELLRDTSLPILYYDDVQLYEDDLHDNGVVRMTIKVRVMPTCVYVLARCWLRVDGVVLRSREVRVQVELSSSSSSSPIRVYRDVLWRECKWKDLAPRGLPTHVRAWFATEGAGETPQWNALIQHLPTVPLPNDIPAHSVLEL